MKVLLVLFFLTATISFAQILDFENLESIPPGSSINNYTFIGGESKVRFFSGFNIKDTLPLTLQKVGYNSNNGGFYGAESSVDCNGNPMRSNTINQVNGKQYLLNDTISNRARVGCYFISGMLVGTTIPSIFIQYEEEAFACSGDLLDVDGNDNSIEAYDIYYYSSLRDYPNYPINATPIQIRSVGKTYGRGNIGDNGGVAPFKIVSSEGFQLIEIRPITQVTPRNSQRTIFGFALDNFSPNAVEAAPYTPPYLTNNIQSVELKEVVKQESLVNAIVKVEDQTPPASPIIKPPTIYFNYDSFELTSASKKSLDQFHTALNQSNIKKIKLTGFTDGKGSTAYNLTLAARRIEAVQEYLNTLGGMKIEFQQDAQGENYLGNRSDEDWKKRCVTLIIQ